LNCTTEWEFAFSRGGPTGSSLPVRQNGTPLAYSRAGNWQVLEGVGRRWQDALSTRSATYMPADDTKVIGLEDIVELAEAEFERILNTWPSRKSSRFLAKHRPHR